MGDLFILLIGIYWNVGLSDELFFTTKVQILAGLFFWATAQELSEDLLLFLRWLGIKIRHSHSAQVDMQPFSCSMFNPLNPWVLAQRGTKIFFYTINCDHFGRVWFLPFAQRFKGHQQDVVEQMLVGLGWRITGHCDTADTRTVAITSRDAQGVRFIITAHKDMTGDGLMQLWASEPGSKGPMVVDIPSRSGSLAHGLSWALGRIHLHWQSYVCHFIFHWAANFQRIAFAKLSRNDAPLHNTASCKPLSPFSSGVASSNGQSFPCIIYIYMCTIYYTILYYTILYYTTLYYSI